LFFHKNNKTEINKEAGLSIVITAKNEYRNLKRFLPKILEQDYKNYEVIVVNNESNDDTEFLLHELKSKYPHLNYFVVQSSINFFKGKKFPLSVGIKSAKYDTVLLTDADCVPFSDKWASEIMASYKDKTEIVLGYGAYEERKGLLNKLIRYDTIRVAITYLSFAKWGIPYMGVGRNLSYKKELFFNQNGFQSHYRIASGDDDLFINKAATRKNTEISLSPESKTISIPETKFSDWFNQKRRHFSTGKNYKKSHLFLLGIWEMSGILFIITLFLIIYLKLILLQSLIIITLWIIIKLIVTKKFMILQAEKKLLLLSPLLDIIIMILSVIINLSNVLLKQRKWK
jgi:glycosyltransferase involved in cell wall biosynthesis